MSKTALILFNRISAQPKEDELDVLDQVKLVSDALKKLKFTVLEYQIDLNLGKAIREIRKINPTFIFNLAETLDNKGEFAYIPAAILSHLEIPFSGNPLIPMFYAANKVLAKTRLSAIGVKTPAWATLDQLHKLKKNKKYILKPTWEEGSLGLDEDSVFEGSDKEFIRKITSYNKHYFFVEEYIEGREFNVSIIGTKDGPKVLPIAEMTFLKYPEGKPKIMGYTAKWKEDSFEYSHTRRTFKLSPEDKGLQKEIEKICKKCWIHFGFKGYVRIDFRMGADRVPMVIDLNLNPCISESGGFVAASFKAGYKFVDVIRMIVDEAMKP
ncbi:MAG: ATP-grasp domain-containing protein [Bacteroidetes bacterium]|nr:ATP-grasp domain-containing protein [Bacteroidota bacterium]